MSVENAIGFDHFISDPGASAALARCAALAHDFSVGEVLGNFEFATSNGLLEAACDANVGRPDDTTRIGGPPQNGLTCLIPGKYSRLVGG